MSANRQREKLVNAALYFARNTENFGLIKLFKLLYFLDFEHYKDIGRSVTGLEYEAWELGPVPEKLNSEIKQGAEQDLLDALNIDLRSFADDKKYYKITAKRRENHMVFSPREEEIMKRLVSDFKFHTAEQMTEATHLPNLPWFQVWRDGEGEGDDIPYDLGVPEADKNFIAYIRSENSADIKYGR
jgi:uncharacterized phage-associated protein